MEFIRTKNYGTEMNVVFTGDKYTFFDGFHGLVAIATRESEPGDMNALFSVEHTDVINEALIKRIINKCESRYIDINVSYTFKLFGKSQNLPYYADVDIKRY